MITIAIAFGLVLLTFFIIPAIFCAVIKWWGCLESNIEEALRQTREEALKEAGLDVLVEEGRKAGLEEAANVVKEFRSNETDWIKREKELENTLRALTLRSEEEK
jgi:hypothetical protein